MLNVTLSRQTGELSSASSRSFGGAWSTALVNTAEFPLNSVCPVNVGSNRCPFLSVKTQVSIKVDVINTSVGIWLVWQIVLEYGLPYNGCFHTQEVKF